MTKGPVTTKKIGVLMGGTSSERDVSVRSGLAIYQALTEMGYSSYLIDVPKDLINSLKKEKVRLAFLALHGGTGENGAIQGMLELLGIPYTGSGILASALAMDKEASKKVFLYHNLPVPPFVVVTSDKLQVKYKKNPFALRMDFYYTSFRLSNSLTKSKISLAFFQYTKYNKKTTDLGR